MDRLNQLRGAAGSSSDSTLDTTSPPSEAFITANESSSKYFSLSEVDSTFDISPIKDVSLASASSDPERTITGEDELISNLSPISKKSDILDSYKIGKQIEAANILSGGVNIFDDNDNSYDGDELVIDDNVEIEKSNPELKQNDSVEFKPEDNLTESTMMDGDTDIASKDTEVVLQIDGKNVDAINIGNGLYLYRKAGQEELAAVQIIDDDQQQPSFKFLKVRENSEGNLEVYEEIEIEVPKEVPAKEGKMSDKSTSHVPIKDINKIINDQSSNKVVERKNKTPQKETTLPAKDEESEIKDVSESKSEVNLNGKMMKFSESRKSPVIGTFTPMTYHSTPNKEGIPLTKTMVDLQLQPSRNSDNVKKTIEVHTDSCKQKNNDTPNKGKDFGDHCKENEISDVEEFSTPIKELDRFETIVVDEPKKFDMEKEANDDNKGGLISNVAEVSDQTPIIPEEQAQEHPKNNDDSDENIAAPSKIDKKDDIGTHDNTQKTTSDTPILMNVDQPELSLGVPIIENSEKLEITKSTSGPINPQGKDIVKNNNESEEKVNLISTSGQIAINKMDILETITEDKPPFSPEAINNITPAIDTNKETSNIIDTNKAIETAEILNSNSTTSTKSSIICVNIGREVSDINKSNPSEQSVKSPSHNQLSPITDKIELHNVKEQASPSAVEIKENIPEKTKNYPMEQHKKESVEKKGNEIPLPNVEDMKQEPVPDINSQIGIVSVNEKSSELDTKPIQSVATSAEEKKLLIPTECKLIEQSSEDQQTADEKLSVIKDDSSNKIIKDNEHPNPVADVNEMCSLDTQKADNKVVAENPISEVVPKVHEVSMSKAIPKSDVQVATIDDTKEGQICPPEDGSKTKVDKNSTENMLQNESTFSAASIIEAAKTENTPTTTKLEEVKVLDNKKDNSKTSAPVNPKPVNNNAAVPFGKWTEANRQEFLNKIKESKVPVNTSNSKPIKNSNDLNRRDVLKKIDSQRQSNNAASKAQEANKLNMTNESVFINKPMIINSPVVEIVNQESNIPTEVTESKTVATESQISSNQVAASNQELQTSTKSVTTELKTSAKAMVTESKLPTKLSAIESKILKKASVIETKIFTKPEATESKILKKADTAVLYLPAKSEATKSKVPAKIEVMEPKITAKAESTGLKISAKSESMESKIPAKADATVSKVSTKTEATESKINSKVDTTESKHRTKTETTVSKISGKVTAPETKIPAKVEAAKSKIPAKTVATECKFPVNAESSESRIHIQAEATESKRKSMMKKGVKKEIPSKIIVKPVVTTTSDTSVAKNEMVQRKVNTQDLIDKTIEGIINKGFISKFNPSEAKSNATKETNNQKGVEVYTTQPAAVQPTSLDAIEMKMNELHGIPFIERPAHELPRPQNSAFNNYNKGDKEKLPEKSTKQPNPMSYSTKNPTKSIKDNVVDFDSEEEVIEYEPVTGDMEIVKKALPSNLPLKEKLMPVDTAKQNVEACKKDNIITENDFDKFARRNSVTYENCITVSYDGKEPHNVIQTVVEKDAVKNYPKIDAVNVETKPKTHKPQKISQPVKVTNTKIAANEDPTNKNYQSKLQIAYQSALTAKRHMESPITVIEDKPVKVVFMDANPEFIANKLNVQGQNLSPAKKSELEMENIAANDSLDSDITETVFDNKLQDAFKPKSKHQRKQVLTPVEAPEIELIEPSDLGIEVSPKKKRKTEDVRPDKNAKNVLHKKSYLLGRSVLLEDKTIKPDETVKNPINETIHRNDNISNNDTVSALDNLVKAAELLENQSETVNTCSEPSQDSPPTTPVKRGRGRPRKYPLPENTVDIVKVPSPQKKPRLIDAKPNKRDTTTEEEDSSDEEIVKENWTMGKINENIVCPICNKLFRSENVVFKHVKHCTGPSPNRSDADKRSVRRGRQSQESDSKSEDMDIDEDIAKEIKKYTPKKRISKDSNAKSDTDKEESIIVIEDTPVKEKVEKDDRKQHESRKLSKTKIQNRIVNNLVCEFCGKTFRQLSYLANHKLQHKKEEIKKTEKDVQISKSVFCCDICKKEFRKLHHLVQHRLIHNPQMISSRLSRKSSSDHEEPKSEKEDTTKQSDDPSAGFRCEPCDKSFRKLHHLVEHRETHDGINRQKGTATAPVVVEKPSPSPQCEICKKTFRKLHHLMEHKEQHLETSSEKSDDKSVKSSLSTKDIIHECPLCYMVFPNEHSLNKHTIICQRKKRQSKQPKIIKEEGGDNVDTDDNIKSDENKSEDNDEPEIIAEEIKVINLDIDDEKEKTNELAKKKDDIIEINENLPLAAFSEKKVTQQEIPKDESGSNISISKNPTIEPELISEVEEITMKEEKEVEKSHHVPKKKTPVKGKVSSITSKRQKLSVPPADDTKQLLVETSDDDDVRYMLNPDFKVDETSEGKSFMKVRAKKRNSLQIERPNSKDLIKRRTSLQHPPKIPRLKPKPIEPKVTVTASKNGAKSPKLEPVPSTDSDDSDVKYSFPKVTPERTPLRERLSREVERKPQRKSLTEKRKTLSCIAKRKSSGKTTAVRHKEIASPPKQVKRRTAEVEHRCDCGQLFSSAALLSRHTTLAHTPPRIRKRRSPPPDPAPPPPAPRAPPAPRSKPAPATAKPAVSTRKSSVKSPPGARKSTKPVEKPDVKKSITTVVKGRRSVSTRTTTVPEKTKKSTQKSKI